MAGNEKKEWRVWEYKCLCCRYTISGELFGTVFECEEHYKRVEEINYRPGGYCLRCFRLFEDEEIENG
ncbi:MAG: hypothetical protein ABH864_06515 [archaeon]